MSHSHFDADYVFAHHAPTAEKEAHYDAIRSAAKHFAEAILANTPASADRDGALQLVREAAMLSNAAIALDGRLTKAHRPDR